MNYYATMIKPASGTCMLRCKYCFYEEESSRRKVKNRGVMTKRVMTGMIDQILNYFKTETVITFAFQGGEPTCAGLDWFETFIDYVNRNKKTYHTIKYAIQTNGILLDDLWAEFLKRNHFLVGISIDGPKWIHDPYRIDAVGGGTYDRVMESVNLLRKYNVPFNVMSVLSSELSKHPAEYWQWLRENRFDYVQLTPCLPSSGNDPYALHPEEFFSFYDGLFPLWDKSREAGEHYSISLFDNVIPMFAGIPPVQCGFLGKCFPQFVIEADGSCYPCDFYCVDQYVMGNAAEKSPGELLRSRALRSFAREPRRKCRECDDCRFEGMCHRQCKRMNVCYFDRNYCGYRSFLEKYEGKMRIAATWIQEIKRR